MITYNKLFDIMKQRKISFNELKRNGVIAQETYDKIKKGTGIYASGKIYGTVSDNKKRITAIDTKSIEKLCVFLDLQPSEIMTVIPNKWDKAQELCKALDCSIDELSDRLPMEEKADE